MNNKYLFTFIFIIFIIFIIPIHIGYIYAANESSPIKLSIEQNTENENPKLFWSFGKKASMLERKGGTGFYSTLKGVLVCEIVTLNMSLEEAKKEIAKSKKLSGKLMVAPVPIEQPMVLNLAKGVYAVRFMSGQYKLVSNVVLFQVK